MDEKDITAEMAHEAIARQSNEDEVASVFRLHIMRFWSRERNLNFCLHLLGVDLQEWQAWREAVEHGVQADECPYCHQKNIPIRPKDQAYGVCPNCGTRRSRKPLAV